MRYPFSKRAKDAPESAYFQRAKSAAEAYARDADKTGKLLDEAAEKARRHRGPLAEVWDYLTALLRLLRAYIRREYTTVPWQTIVLAIAAVLYFVTPIDAIFDFIPVFGYIDDAAVIAFVVRSIKGDLDQFLAWEAGQSTAPASK